MKYTSKEFNAWTGLIEVPPLLSVKNVFLRPGEESRKEILKNININLKKNGIVILKGPPGSGKSSLIKVLCGRCRPSSGRVLFKGNNIYKMKKSGQRKFNSRVAWAMEENNYINRLSLYDTLAEIIRLQDIPPKVAFDRIMHSLKLTGLIASRDIPVGKLSSSEKKLFKLASAIIREPELIMLDFNLCSGSFSGEVVRLIKRISSRGTGVVLTAKETAELKVPRRMCLRMKNGQIL